METNSQAFDFLRSRKHIS